MELHPEAIIVDLAPPPHENWAVDTPEQSETLADGGLRITSPMRIHFRGGRTSRIENSAAAGRARPDRTLIAGLRRAHAELNERGIDMRKIRGSIDHARGVDDPYLRNLSRLAFLAPDIQRAILEGRQPANLRLADILSSDLPLRWDDQRELLGFT